MNLHYSAKYLSHIISCVQSNNIDSGFKLVTYVRSPNMQITNYVYDCVNGRACINYSKSRGFTRLYNSMLYAWHLLYRCYKTKFCKSLIAENFIATIKNVKNNVVKDLYEMCIRFV